MDHGTRTSINTCAGPRFVLLICNPATTFVSMRGYGARRRFRPRGSRSRRFRKFRRSYRRSTVRRPGRAGYSRKAIVNMAATKKRDNMISCAITEGGVPNVPGLPFVMNGAQEVWMFAFVPSARRLHDGVPSTGVRGYDFSREHRDTFSVGYSERVTLTANTGANWRWRRIVFTMKTLEPAQAFQSGALFNYVNFEGVKPGYVRAMYDFSQDALPRALLQQELFQGTAGTDYSDPFNAPVDKTRVRVLYDRNIAVNGHNDEGHWKVKRFYHRNGRKLIYNEKESGDRKDGATEGSHFNTGGRVGDGDLWVVDMFAGIGSQAGDTLRFLPQGTYYWHERG